MKITSRFEVVPDSHAGDVKYLAQLFNGKALLLLKQLHNLALPFFQKAVFNYFHLSVLL